MVVGVDPVADLLAVAVDPRPAALEHLGDLARDELLDVLPGPVVVGAVGDRRAHAEAADPGADEVVGAGLRGGVRAARAVRRVLGEALRVVEARSPYTSSVETWWKRDVGPADRLEQDVGADHVGPDERLGVVEGVVVVGLGREVHDGVVGSDERLDRRGVGDVALHQLDPVGRQVGQGLGARGVGELVEHGDRGVGVLDEVADEVGADETGATGDEEAVHGADLGAAAPRTCSDGAAPP